MTLADQHAPVLTWTEPDGIVGPALRRGALYEPVPAGWLKRADPAAAPQPVLGLHGDDDPASPLAAVRAWYAAVPSAELVSIVGGLHDALNDQMHRTAAATVILFLERLRLAAAPAPGTGLPPIAVHEILDRASV